MARYEFNSPSGLDALAQYRVDTASGSSSAATIQLSNTFADIPGALLWTDDAGKLPDFIGSAATLYAKRVQPGGATSGSPTTMTGILLDQSSGGGGGTVAYGTTAGTAAEGNDARITGAAQKSANLSDLASASTSRTNLGLGGSATLAVGTTAGTVAAGDDSRVTGAAQKASNLSDLASASTSRTNLGLGSAATMTPATLAADSAFTATYAAISSRQVNLSARSGADPTGATDSTTALASLLSALSTFGGGTVVTDGTFLTDPFTVPAGVTVTGPGVMKMKAQTTVVSFITLATGGARLRGLKIDGNGAAHSANWTAVKAFSQGTVESCDILTANGGIGVAIVDGSDGTPMDDVAVRNNRIIGGTSARTAIQNLNPSRRLSVIGNQIQTCSAGVAVNAGGGAHLATDLAINGNIITGTTSIPIEIQNGSRATVANNTISGSGTNGISVGVCDYLTVTGNSVKDQTSYGLELGTGSHQTITGNVIADCGLGAGINGTSANLAITGNLFLRCNGASNGDAIRCVANGLTNAVVSGNVFTDIANGSAIQFSSTGTKSDIVIANNLMVLTAAGAGAKAQLIRVANASRVDIRANSISVGVDINNNQQAAIYVDGTCDAVTITENAVRSTTGSAVRSVGIATAASGSDVKITRNQVTGFAVGIANTMPGSLNGQTTDVIKDNTLSGNTANYSLLTGTATYDATNELLQQLLGEGSADVVTVARGSSASLSSYSSGQMAVAYFTPVKSLTITKIAASSAGAASGTATLVRFGLFTAAADEALTLVAATASDTAIFASANTLYERSLSSGGGLPTSYTLVEGTRYAIGIVAVGYTTWVVTGIAGSGTLMGLSRKLAGVIGSQTDLPTSYAGASVSADSRRPFARLAA